MPSTAYTDSPSHVKIKRLLEEPRITRGQANFLKDIVAMAHQVPSFQAIERTVGKVTYDRYFHYLIPKSVWEINCKRALYDCGIPIKIDVDKEDTVFVISLGEVERANGFYIKFTKK